MKRMLPIWIMTLFCLPLGAFAGKGGPSVDFSADNRQGCLSLTVNFFDDTFFSGGDVVTEYTWDFGDGTVSTDYNPTPSHTYTTPGSYTVTLTVVTLAGDTGSLSKSNYISIGSDFSVDLGPDTLICGISPFALNATTSGATYQWSTGATTPTINAPSSGTYSVRVTHFGCIARDTVTVTLNALSVNLGADQDLCFGSTLDLSAGNAGADFLWSTGETTSGITIWDEGQYFVDVTKDGCSVSDTIIITSKPGLNLAFGFAKISGCVPVDYQFTDSSTACSGTITDWAWDFGDGSPISTQKNPKHTFTAQGNYTVRLTVTGSNQTTLSKSRKVKIDPVSVNVDLGADTTICFGQTLTLDAMNPGASFTWNTGAHSQQIAVLTDGEYRVAVTKDGCVVSDTISVHTAVSSVAQWGHSLSGTCLPVTATFADSSVAFCGQTINSWKWDFGDGSSSTQRNPVHNYATADSFTVKLTVKTSGGNTAFKIKKIKVSNAAFTVDLPSELKVCRNGTVDLDAGVSDASYAWTPSYGLSATNIRNPTLTPSVNGWYSVTVNKCSASATDSVYVTVDSTSSPFITQNGNSLSAPAGSGFEWFREGKKVQGADTRAIRVDQAGYYTVRMVNNTGCSGTSDPFFYVPVSGDEKLSNGILVKISPNPGKGVIRLLFSKLPTKPAKVSVYDANGKFLLATAASAHVNNIDLTKLLKGLYFIEVLMDNERSVLPLVIH